MRIFSFAQESTRYCNYSKDKFGNELTFIKPYFIPENLHLMYYPLRNLGGAKDYELIDDNGKIFDSDEKTKTIFYMFLDSIIEAEDAYKLLLSYNLSPQGARSILPNALKTEINMCGFIYDWEHFFELRDSSNAHPDMQNLARPLHQMFKDLEYI